MTSREIARMIDHSLLKPDLTVEDIRTGCTLARQYQTASVCVRPCDVALAESMLRGSNIAVGTVIAFPHGSNQTEVKILEAKRAMDDGAVDWIWYSISAVCVPGKPIMSAKTSKQ